MASENTTANGPVAQKASQPFVQAPARYIGEPRKKDYYDSMYEIIAKHGVKSVVDVGCAAGDFLYFMPSSVKGIGIDKSQELIAEARLSRKKDNLQFEVMDVFAEFDLPPVDCITVSGTMVTFATCLDFLDACFAAKPKLILINDFFNSDGLDTKFGYKDPDGQYQFPYNVWSMNTISEYLKSKSAKFSFETYEMKTELKKDINNPTYMYHANLDGERILTNGLGIILRGYNLTIFPAGSMVVS